MKITSTNAIFGEEVFLISDITSASVFQSKSSIVSSSIAFIMGLAGIIFILVGLVLSINLDLVGYSIFGLILIGVGKFIESPTYGVEIVISSGKIEVFESRNQAKCKTIVDRLNEEIAKKEESPASKENHVSV